ncbi:hypothetical protein [Catellatospora tritici]|uniref:hypothetical protein n=1 Tax=Catellatospora tritici TaxID=2851566 RepID=UPI001C2DE402|nr:hypothetical protein [Catellatospora tritici]MBV1851920.1 hypothetical protein [Catellatospora tritici]
MVNIDDQTSEPTLGKPEAASAKDLVNTASESVTLLRPRIEQLGIGPDIDDQRVMGRARR